MQVNLDWSKFKAYVDKHNLSIQELDDGGGYILVAYRSPFNLNCYVKNGSADKTDYENNYQENSDEKVSSEVEVKEENVRTGGHYQASGYELDVGTGDSIKTINITFPHPVSLLAAEWVNKSAFDGDEIEFLVAPDAVVGTLSADEAAGQTVLSVSQSVIDNIQLGYFVKLADGTNTDDCGCVTAIDTAANTITVETATVNAFAAATPTYVKMTVKMLHKSPLDTSGRVQLGESKIGGSYIAAGTVLRAVYYNNDAAAKKLRFFLEYLY